MSSLTNLLSIAKWGVCDISVGNSIMHRNSDPIADIQGRWMSWSIRRELSCRISSAQPPCPRRSIPQARTPRSPKCQGHCPRRSVTRQRLRKVIANAHFRLTCGPRFAARQNYRRQMDLPQRSSTASTVRQTSSNAPGRASSENCATFRIAVTELENELGPQSLRSSSCPCRTGPTEHDSFHSRIPLVGGHLAITRTAH